VRTLALSACPVCGGEQAEPVDLGAGEHRRCRDCDTVYSTSYADPGEVFTDAYFTGADQFGVDVAHPRFQAYLGHVGQCRVKLLERVTRGPGSLLDVGCGTGEFGAAAVRHGWRVQGVELIPAAAEHARTFNRLDVREGLLAESGLPERAYDVVSALHVAEHVPDVVAFLRELAGRVRHGGHVLIEVPNLDSSARAASGAAWAHLRPLEHLTQFTPATLRRALLRAGLEPVQVSTPTWIWRNQTRAEALRDLGRDGQLQRLRRVPRRAAWPMQFACEAADRRHGRGAVVFAVARVP
jgi:2-polyprenyl-3-methyl-5-hydroxy-6-metoxy-1,4-benzoquinol methylase